MQGTLLQSLSDSYGNISQCIAQLERHRDQTEGTMPELREKWQRLARKEKENTRLLDMRAEYQNLEKELAWAYVVDKTKVSLTPSQIY